MGKARPIGLGLIGCGIAATELHWPALAKLRDEFVVVGVCNHTPEKAKRLSETIAGATGREIPNVLDYRELLASSEVEAVSIMLPVERNREVCAAAAGAGKHILVEKPIAEDEASARAILELEKEHAGLVLMVAENFRYRPLFRALADALAEGAIGTPYVFEWRHWHRIDPQMNPYAQTAWRIHHRYEGGFVTDGGVHNVAALRDVFGNLSVIGSAAASVNPEIGRTDTLVCLFRSEGRGAIPSMPGVLSMGCSVRGTEESRLVVLGSLGSAVVEGSRLEIHAASTSTDAVVELPDDGGYAEEYRDFHRAITTGSRPRSTLAEGAEDLATILRALRAAH